VAPESEMAYVTARVTRAVSNIISECGDCARLLACTIVVQAVLRVAMLAEVGLIFVSLLFVSSPLTNIASVPIVGNGTIPGTVTGSTLGGGMSLQCASSD